MRTIMTIFVTTALMSGCGHKPATWADRPEQQPRPNSGASLWERVQLEKRATEKRYTEQDRNEAYANGLLIGFDIGKAAAACE